LLIGLIVGSFAWWANSLSGLPDVGDAFDVGAFLDSARVPEEEDASLLYDRAAGMVGESPVSAHWPERTAATKGGWTKADPRFRAWIEGHREVLETWKEATRKRVGSPVDLRRVAPFEGTSNIPRLILLTEAALLEGSRLEADDPASALDWYLAVQRSVMHGATRGTLHRRMLSNMHEAQLRDRFLAWAAQPRTTPELLRRAIRELTAIDAATPPLSDNLKAEYLSLMHGLDDVPLLQKRLDRSGETTFRFDDWPRALRAYWFVRREPERSRRVARLFFANWLAHCDDPPLKRPPTASNPQMSAWALFRPTPGEPRAAHALPPETTLSWLQSTSLLRPFLPSFPSFVPSTASERQGRGTLIVAFAKRLYFLENGKEPPTPEALVPKYLDALPEEYSE
jgi:hypothetical protein